MFRAINCGHRPARALLRNYADLVNPVFEKLLVLFAALSGIVD
jgi:hypothetical protein